MSGRKNLIIMLGLDTGLIVLSFYTAYLIRFEFDIPGYMMTAFNRTWPWIAPLKLVTFWFFGLYRGMWRYTSLVDLIRVVKAVVTSSLILVLAVLMLHRFYGYPRSVFILDAILTFMTIGGARVVIRLYYAQTSGIQFFPGFGRLYRRGIKKLMLVGAGDAAERILREIQGNPDLDIEVVGIIDENVRLKGKAIHGVLVLGDLNFLDKPPVEYDEILIAVPSAQGEDMRRIVSRCEATGKPFRTVPAMGELINGSISVKSVRNVRVEDLMGRAELHLDQDEISRYLKDKRILITGAGGSIGSELVRQVGRFNPEAIALLEISELNLFVVEMEFRQRFKSLPVYSFLADIRNRETVKRVFSEFQPQVVFHAAAYKHVPMQEIFPWEAVTNNIQGTRNLVELSMDHSIERFVLVSTDKAVRPTNVMGATKRVAEMLVECTNGKSRVGFMAVRFGNVMGSSGSAIPVFRDQIARGGPVTITHPEVTRYFMSVGEAAELILQAGALGRGGEIFILEMGKPIKILDLVRDMIRLHGFEPETEIPIKFIGLRPGEKLYEELITEGEGIISTGHDKIMVLKGNSCRFDELTADIDSLLRIALTFDEDAIKRKLQSMVPEYKPGD